MRIFIFAFINIITFQSLFSQQIKKPNILFIAIDDLKPTLGCYGDTFAITPNIDAIAKKGILFLNNHTQQAVCAPSRASLLTGKRPDYTKVWDLNTKIRTINPDILTLPQYFKQQGYKTIGVGKIYDKRCVDKDRDKLSWSVPYFKEKDLEYPKGYNQPTFGFYQSKAILKHITTLRDEAKAQNVPENAIYKYVSSRYKPPYEIGDVPDNAYVDGAIANKSVQLLDEMDPSKPFFLAVGFKRPHLPFVSPKKYWELYDETKIKLSVYQEQSKHAVDIAYHKSNEIQSYKTPEIEYQLNEKDLLVLDKKVQKKLIHGYYAATSYIDAQIGKIINKLKERGLDKNTIIVVWGDHGWHLGDHNLWNKHSNFEQATRSPLIIYNPNTANSNRITSPTEFVDIFPTLCEMAEIKTPKTLDGTSLNGFITGEVKTTKTYAVSQYPRGNIMGYSFRTEQYRYTVWIKNKKSTEPIYSEDIYGEELYDYKCDPNETGNKINAKKYQSIKKTLKTLATRYFKTQSSIKKESIKNWEMKNKYAQTKANTLSDFIASKMNLTKSKATFLSKTLYIQYTTNAQKILGKDLSQTEKEVIYNSTFSMSRKKLLEKFTKEEVQEINKLERTKQKTLNTKE